MEKLYGYNIRRPLFSAYRIDNLLYMRKVIVALMLLAATHLQAQTLTSGGKLKPEQAIMDVRHYTIALNVDFSQRSIEGYTTIDV
ncbi:MAG: pepN 2, partial [Mucilaginibacter sp.]|nr:pepN 2 [Mucilaginibacter sp.]